MVYQNKIKFMNNNYKNCNNKMIIKKILMHNNYKKKGNKMKNYKNNQMIYYKIKKYWMIYQNKIKIMNNNYKNINNKMIIKKI